MVVLTLEKGIIIARFEKGAQMNMDMAQQLISDRKKLQGEGMTNPLLVYIDSIVSNSKAVRIFMANKGTEGISSAAFVIKNRALELFINFFLKMDSPKIPIKVFYNEDDAFKWTNSLNQINNE